MNLGLLGFPEGLMGKLRDWLVPTGSILDYGGGTIPRGYLLCDGSNYRRSDYGRLFGKIGVTWGAGNGNDTFTVPDFRRRSSIGSGGSGTGTVGNAVGNSGGEEAHTMTTGELVSHAHTQQGSFGSGGFSVDHTHTYTAGSTTTQANSSGAPNVGGAVGGSTTSGASANHTHTTTISGATANNGSSTAFNVYHPVAVVTKMIKI